MGIFGGKKKVERKLSLEMGLHVFTSDDEFLTYRTLTKHLKVNRHDIESVSLDANSMVNNILKINGKGTTLAQIKLPGTIAAKAQKFIMREALVVDASKTGSSNLDEIEKLADLKDKGILTQDEFDKKKKQLLGI